MNIINKATVANFFIKGFSFEAVRNEINRLSWVARQLYFAHDYEAVLAVSDRILELSHIAENRGLYFRGLALSRLGGESQIQAYRIYQHLAESPQAIIRASGHLHLASYTLASNDLTQALKLATEAHRLSLTQDWCAPLVTFQAQNLSAINGESDKSLELLWQNRHLAKHLGSLYPALEIDYLNSIAYELHQVGQVEYAAHLIEKVKKTPYFLIEPEYQATYAEIQEARACYAL
jgi:hypothetical protein